MLFVNVNMDRPDVPTWLGHRVNDGAVVESNTEAGVLDYYEKSRQAKNCVPVPFGPSPVLATVTTCQVKKGDEIFTSYGCSYWLEAIWPGEESTDITEDIQFQVRETARDLFTGMQGVRANHGKEWTALEASFAKMLVSQTVKV
jgi:hypothetical protein